MKNGETLEYLEHSIYTGLLKSLIDSDNREDWLKAEEIVEALISETYKTKDISLYFLSRAFSGEEGSEKLYRKIAEKFSVEFVDFMISQFQDWLIKKYPYDMSFVLDDNEWKIEIKYMGNNCFIFEVNDNIRKGDIYFDSIGDEKELSSTILKTLNIEKDRVSDLKINFNLLSKRYLAFSVNQNIFVKDKYEFEEKLELLKNVLKEFSFINPEYIRSKIEDFFENKHEAFVRIALFLIDANWDEYNTFFFASFLSQPAQFFDKHFIKNDIKTFLERNINKFSLEQKEKLSDCIINGPYYNASLYNDKNKMIYRLEWYYKIKHDRFFEKIFNELDSKLNIDHKELEGYGHTEWYTERSPQSVDELNNMSILEIINFIQSFEPDNETYWNRGSIRQLAISVAQLLKMNPSKLYDLIETNFVLPYVYADRIITAFKENWKNGETRKWVDLKRSFNFIGKYLEYVITPNDDLLISSESYIGAKFVAGSIASFISSGNSSSENEFPEDYFEKCKEIVLVLTQNISVYKDVHTNKVIQDSGFREYTLNHLLNSDQGKILHAHYYVSRRLALKEKDKKEKLAEDFKQSLLECFHQKVRDAFIVFGSFVTSYAYFDEEFTFKQIDEFISLDEENWKSFFGGWLFWDFQGYSPMLHAHLIPHYLKAIENGFDVKGIQEPSGLARKISVAYYWGYEDVNGELLNIFLNKSSIDKLERLIQILRFDYKELKKNLEMKSRVIPLWDKIIAVLKIRKEEEKDKVITEMLSLSKYTETLDEQSVDRFLFVLNADCKRIYLREFLKELQRFLKKDNVLQIAQYICSLIEPIVNKYYPRPDDDLKNLIIDLFEMRLPEQNSRLRQICNRIIEVNEGYLSWPMELVRKYLGGEQKS